ncbi:hypothetical protein OIDMADRAFT_123078 [Oidiodendron maius Zn]|uniref:Sm protein F n=1 Tax=Oidiodendron maius (strain Zn) TaxID=913774 RepID=A0A0C3DHQ9_OIDMZ|nr:hypothetical protein OIDMADRAFT_123078 [Oidiodendron maius Zn]
MLSITLTADLVGVTELQPVDTAESPFWYTFKVQCTSCREVHPNPVSVSRFESNEMSGSRGEANFVWKCKSCKRESSATIKAAPVPYQQSSPPTSQKMIEFDCRGLEFTEFMPDGEWIATGIDSGSKFGAIDLTEGEWFDYDEKAGDEFVPINPRPMLQNLVNEEVIIRLKWGQTEYKGRLVSIDSYMNIQLSGAEEWIDQQMTSALGQVLIRYILSLLHDEEWIGELY